MRNFCAIITVAGLLTTSAFAADAPLPFGKPAGVEPAQRGNAGGFYVIGGVLILAGVVYLVAGNPVIKYSNIPIVPPVTSTSGTTT